MSNSQKKWQRPRTTRAYLHPPLAERLALIWPEFKITDSSLLDNGTHVEQPGVGMILLHGEEMESFNFKETRFSPVSAGLPFYTLNSRTDCAVSMEAFCNFDRIPTTFFRVTLKNDSAVSAAGCLGVLCRNGCEAYMVQQHQEGYAPYNPNLKNWYMLKRTWKQTGPASAEGEKGSVLLQVPDTLKLSWVSDGATGIKFEAADYFRIDYALAPGETVSFEGAFRSTAGLAAFDYDAEKAASAEKWKETLEPLAIVPDTDNAVYQDVYRHLAMQLCQMLARYEGSDGVATRQGDLGRFIWPYEATLLLTVMDRVGLRKYTADAYRYFCERWLVTEGPDEGRIQSSCAAWENFTGSTVWGLSEHLKTAASEEELAYFLPKLKSMVGWIDRRRKTPAETGYAGIFPVGKGSDWAEIAQFWTFTDSYNVYAIKSMAEMLDQYGRPEAAEYWAIHKEYDACIREIRDEIYKGHEDDECFIFPHELGIPFEDSENYSYYVDGAPFLLRTGFIEPNSRMRVQMENFFRKNGQFERGLTGLMTSCVSAWDGGYHGGYGDVWYTIQSELFWLPTWMAAGETEKAKETMEALMKYSLTSEYITSERYCSINEWYSPWQPNGSGSASFMSIMLSYFGERKIKE